MPTNVTGKWKSLERRNATAFLIAGTMFIIDAVIVGIAMSSAGDRVMLLGQAFIAAGWTAGFVGLLGVYPELVDRSPRLARAGAVFVSIGVVVFTVMGLASLAFYTGILNGDLSVLVPLFLPGVIIGSVLGFLTFGATTLRTGVYPQRVGVLFIMLGLFPVVNIGSGIAGIQSMTATLAIVVGLALVTLALSYLLRDEGPSTDHVDAESAREPAA